MSLPQNTENEVPARPILEFLDENTIYLESMVTVADGYWIVSCNPEGMLTFTDETDKQIVKDITIEDFDDMITDLQHLKGVLTKYKVIPCGESDCCVADAAGAQRSLR